MERADLELLSLEAPLGAATIVGTLATAVLQRLKLGFLEPLVRRTAAFLDQRLRRLQPGKAYARSTLRSRSREPRPRPFA